MVDEGPSKASSALRFASDNHTNNPPPIAIAATVLPWRIADASLARPFRRVVASMIPTGSTQVSITANIDETARFDVSNPAPNDALPSLSPGNVRMNQTLFTATTANVVASRIVNLSLIAQPRGAARAAVAIALMVTMTSSETTGQARTGRGRPTIAIWITTARTVMTSGPAYPCPMIAANALQTRPPRRVVPEVAIGTSRSMTLIDPARPAFAICTI